MPGPVNACVRADCIFVVYNSLQGWSSRALLMESLAVGD